MNFNLHHITILDGRIDILRCLRIENHKLQYSLIWQISLHIKFMRQNDWFAQWQIWIKNVNP